MLRSIGSSIWIAQAPFKVMGINLGNCMTVIKLRDGGLLLHSPNRFDERYCRELDAIGPVKYLVAPNLMHNLFFPEWKARYPHATICAPQGIKKVFADTTFLPDTISKLENRWRDDLSLELVRGIPKMEEVVFYHKPSRTIVFTDLAFNIRGETNLLTKIAFTLYGSYGKFGPTSLIRLLIKDKAAYRESIQRILTWDVENIVVSHGDIVTHDAKGEMQRAFQSARV